MAIAALFALCAVPSLAHFAGVADGVDTGGGQAWAQGDPQRAVPFNQRVGIGVEDEVEPIKNPHVLSENALNKSRSAAMIFWLFALLVVAGSIFVITRSNLITAVMGMVGTFFVIACVYAMLYARFLTAIQVLVYAGAIMVLFVFVIMIINKPEAEPWSVSNLPAKIVIMVALLYLVVRLVLVVWGIEPGAGAAEPPPDVTLLSGETAGFGSTKAIGHTLFRNYLFPFEAVSLVLLIAVVGAVAVARPHERRPAATAQDPNAELGAGAEV
jgi:NADH-quinone oxidoreductase subunit J